MARRQSRVNLEALGVLITDALMRAIVPALDKRIAEASAAALERGVGPMLEQLAALELAVKAEREARERGVSVELVEQRARTTIEACEAMCDRAVARVLESVRPFHYCGAYAAELAYEINESVTHRGSLWMARASVPPGLVPGTDAGAEVWTLAVKCGRDARGA